MKRKEIQEKNMLSKYVILICVTFYTISGSCSVIPYSTIIGIWTEYEKNGIQGNVCPEVEFREGFTGIITYANGNTEHFQWKCDSCLTITQGGKTIRYLIDEAVKNHVRYLSLYSKGKTWTLYRNNIRISNNKSNDMENCFFRNNSCSKAFGIVVRELYNYCKENNYLIGDSIPAPFVYFSPQDSLYTFSNTMVIRQLNQYKISTSLNDFQCRGKKHNVVFCISMPLKIDEQHVRFPIYSFNVYYDEYNTISVKYKEDLSTNITLTDHGVVSDHFFSGSWGLK